jgi:hypothetical protein
MSHLKQYPITQLFTIWIWPEEVGDNQIEWRGQAQHISSGRTCYFRDWQSVTLFMEKSLSGHAPVPQPEDMEDDGPAGT